MLGLGQGLSVGQDPGEQAMDDHDTPKIYQGGLEYQDTPGQCMQDQDQGQYIQGMEDQNIVSQAMEAQDTVGQDMGMDGLDTVDQAT